MAKVNSPVYETLEVKGLNNTIKRQICWTRLKKKKQTNKKNYTLYTGDILDLKIQIDEKQKDGKKQRGYSKYKQKQTLRQKRTSNKKVYFRIIKGSVFKIIINLRVPNNSPKHMQQKVTELKDS